MGSGHLRSIPNDPLLTFRSPSEFLHTGAVTGASGNILPCGFFPFGVSPVPGSYFSRGNQPPGKCPLSVFHALRAFFRLDLPAFFQTGSAHGVLPFRACHTRGAVRPLGRLCPPVVSRDKGHYATQLVSAALQGRALQPIKRINQHSSLSSCPTSGRCSPRAPACPDSSHVSRSVLAALLGFTLPRDPFAPGPS